MSALGPSRYFALSHDSGRYRSRADIAFASRRWVYGYAA